MLKQLLRLAVLALSASLAFAKYPKLASDLERQDPTSDVDVIIQFKQAPTARHHAKVLSRGGQLKAKLDVVKGGAYRIKRGALDDLANDPDVAYISPDRPVHASLNYAVPAVGADIALQSGYDGSGVGVAIIDSGFSTFSDDLNAWSPSVSTNGAYGKPTSRIVYSKSFVSGGTADAYGHGTHVAGILGGDGYDSMGESEGGVSYTQTFHGIAPAVKFINLRALDANGAGTDSSVIAAIDQAIQVQKKYNIRVINLSLGRPIYESYLQDPLCQAVESAWKAGIVVVVAAGNDGRDNSFGNDGYGTITAPGNDPYVITVGAMKTNGTPQRSDDTIASYSSKGPTMIDHFVKPDLVAPGNQVVSLNNVDAALWANYSSDIAVSASYYIPSTSGDSRNYARLNGTSMATPMVSGAVALLLQQNPKLTPDQVKARLMKTAYKTFPASSTATDPTTGITYTSYYDILTVGAGYLDVWAALNDTSVASALALSPSVTYNSTTGTVNLVTDSRSVWGTGVWGVRSVWGTTQFLSGTQSLWGTQSVWGTSGTSAFQSLWGTQSIWGNTTADSVEATAILVNGEN